MTFLEAAIEVLRREGKPLPVKRLAELAVHHNLLSVVGRDPEGTMQARLDEVLDKGPTHAELLRVRPDTFGLRVYPPRPYPPAREGAPSDIAEAEGAETADEADELTTAEAPEGRSRRRRRGRRGRGGAPAGAETNTATEAAAAPEATAAPESAATPATEAAAEGDELLEDEEDPEFDVEADAGSAAPLMVSTAGDEELTRSGEEREVRSEIRGGRREERGRRRRGERGRRDHKDEARPQREPAAAAPAHAHAKPRSHSQPPPQQAQPPSSTPPPLPPVVRGLGGELVELLRANDARPQHVRALAQEVERRKILEGRPQPEIVREVRMALHAEISTRSGRGLRPRVRSLGGGNYALIDRKLDDELVSAERALEVALERQAVATTAAVRRRLSRLSPFSFEQLGRCVAEALGVERPTLVRRGDGVAYYGGERTLGVLGGAQRARVLVGVRSGEAELGRRAIGELRAGLDARGFDEGLLIALGRLSAEGREELRAGRAVTVFDGDSLPGLLIERRLGVRVAHAPIAYLDLDFFSEINET